MQTIKTGMNNKQMKAIAMQAMAGKKPFSVPGTKYKKKMTAAQDAAYDRKHGIKPGSKQDQIMDRKNGVAMKKKTCAADMKKKSGAIKTSGSFGGKSNQLGQGGRAAQMRARGVPGGVIGAIARREQAAPGQKNYHKK